MPREVVPAEKANLDAVTIPAAKLLCPRPNVLQMIAVAGVSGQKPVWMVMSGNVIQHSDGPVASPVSSKKEDKEEKRIKERRIKGGG